MLLKPLNRFGIKMVRRLIEQQNVRLLDHQTAERHPALFSTGQGPHLLLGRRTAQCVHGEIELALQFPSIGGFNLLLQLRLLVEQLFHFVRANLADLVADGFVLMDQRHQLGLPLLDDFLDRLVRIQLRFLFQQADAVAFGSRNLAGIVRIHARNDLEQRTLARSVQSQHTDLCAVVEAEIDLPQHLPLRRIDLPHIDE